MKRHTPFVRTLVGFLIRATVVVSLGAQPLFAQSPPSGSSSPAAKIKIIIDTDIGDDVDDAFAVGLALSSPELEILGITTAWGDTRLRARLTDRLLAETGNANI